MKMLQAGRLDFYIDVEDELLVAIVGSGIVTLNLYLGFANNDRGQKKVWQRPTLPLTQYHRRWRA